MKTPLLIGLLATSLAGNAMLYRTLARPSTAPGTLGGSPLATAAANSAAAAPSLPAWRALDVADPSLLPEHLRDAGLPPKMVAAITQARILDRFAERRREILGGMPPSYWSRDFSQTLYGGKAMRDLSREQRQALRAALGSDPDMALISDEARAARELSYGPLPSEKIDRIMDISSDYSDLRSAVTTEANGLLLAEDRAQLALLAEEERADLQALLTPEEYEEYQLRRSSSATQLRSQLQWVDVTESEFRALYRLQEAYNQAYNPLASSAGSATNAAERRAAEAALFAEARALLGEERGAEFERSRSVTYRQLVALVDRLELPRSTAAEVSALQAQVQQRTSAAQRNAALTPDQRREEIAAIVREAGDTLTQKLGTDGAAVYRQSGGAWLRALEQRTGMSGSATPGR